LQGGLPLEVVSKLLGHSAINVTASTYADVTARMMEPAAQIMDRAMGR
jgi:site-specific recombinase XerD